MLRSRVLRRCPVGDQSVSHQDTSGHLRPQSQIQPRPLEPQTRQACRHHSTPNGRPTSLGRRFCVFCFWSGLCVFSLPSHRWGGRHWPTRSVGPQPVMARVAVRLARRLPTFQRSQHMKLTDRPLTRLWAIFRARQLPSSTAPGLGPAPLSTKTWHHRYVARSHRDKRAIAIGRSTPFGVFLRQP